jgi:hypothetical protein
MTQGLSRAKEAIAGMSAGIGLTVIGSFIGLALFPEFAAIILVSSLAHYFLYRVTASFLIGCWYIRNRYIIFAY